MTNEIVLEYSDYINKLINKYFSYYKNKEDLFQVGCIGLIIAHKRFNPSIGAKFTTYSFSYILGEMYKLIREDKQIKVSQNITKLNLKIEKAKIILVQKLMRYPTIKEISEELDIPEYEIIESLKFKNVISSIDEPINSDGKIITIQDMIASDSTDLNTLLALKEELSNLTKEERYLLDGSINNYRQADMANNLGINQVQVSRKLNKIKQKIKMNIS